MVLLHGFPEFWYSWRHQIEALAEAGYRVIAPDMRGYNLSEKPKGIASYRMEALVGDVLGLIKDAGEESAVVAGHVLAVLLGHHLVQRLVQGQRAAALSQLPLAGFILAYTLFGLWLLATPRGV